MPKMHTYNVVHNNRPLPSQREQPNINLPLPDELILRTFDHLEPRDVLKPVSRAWMQFATDSVLWRGRIQARGWPMPAPSLSLQQVDWLQQYRGQRDLHEPFSVSPRRMFRIDNAAAELDRFAATIPELHLSAMPGPDDFDALLTHYQHLRRLSFENVEALGAEHMQCLVRLPHLEELEFSTIDTVLTVEGAQALVQAAPKLQRLTLDGFDVTPGVLAILCALQELACLRLINDKMIDALPEQMRGMTKLKTLVLQGALNVPGVRPSHDALRSSDLQKDIADMLPQLESLDLSCRRIEHAMALTPLVRLPNLRKLNLSRTMLTTIPVELCTPALEKLNVSANPGFRFPKGAKHLTELVSLKAAGCELEKVPSFVYDLPSLRVLNVSSNSGLRLHFGRGKLARLRELDASYCDLQTLPAAVCQLSKLTHLKLRRNRLTNLPAYFALMRSLTHLDLGHNRFAGMPAPLKKLRSLTWLHMPDMRHRDLPVLAKHFPKLQYFGAEQPVGTRDPQARQHLPGVFYGSEATLRGAAIESHVQVAASISKDDADIGTAQDMKALSVFRDLPLIDRRDLEEAWKL